MSTSPQTAPSMGTAGWSYPHWNGIVYPKSYGAGFHPLKFLSRHFDAVENNSTSYQPLKPEVTRLWMKKVEANPRFQFTAKLHQQFTHARVLDDTEAAAFAEGLRPLLRARKLGALLMQFPWSFRFTAENQDFFIRLRRAFPAFPLEAEIRASSCIAAVSTGAFLAYRAGFFNDDQLRFNRAPPPTDSL